MGIFSAIMVPHPPIILPEIGRGEEERIRATIDAYEQAARFIADAAPETLVVLSPHAEMYRDWFHISAGEGAEGDLSRFGAPYVRLSVRYDAALRDELCAAARREGFPAGCGDEREPGLDHASLIPLYFLRGAMPGGRLPPVVRIGLSGLPLTEHYRLGMLIRETAERLGRRVCVVASGDLSHRLREDGPYGYQPEGPEYDRRIMDVMSRGAFGELFDFGEDFCEKAGECGHSSFSIMAGCFDGQEVEARKLSYEGPFGVGYGVCLFAPGAPSEERRFYRIRRDAEAQALARRREREDRFVRLARLSVETYVTSHRRAKLPQGLPEELTARRAGAFVSLHLHGRLRGCIGTILPTADSVAEEILRNGVSACSQDPRFLPVTPEELPELEYSVDVLGSPEDISSPAELDVKRYGVIVSCGDRRGLLLPDLEGVDTVEEQIAIARQKAGIRFGEPITLQRFEVVRHV